MKSRTACIWLCSALFALLSCKTRQQSSKPKHVFGRTAVAPSSPLNPCKDGTDYPEAVTYVKELANWIMARNPETFTADYSPAKFCFVVSDLAGLNAHSDPATGLITVRAEMVRMSPTTDDALAAVLAHELAHVTMQHRRREPAAADLPKDLDLAELSRRQVAQKTWQIKIESARTGVIDDALRSGFIENTSVLMKDHDLWQRIVPYLGQIDKGSYEQAAKAFSKMDEQFGIAIKNPHYDSMSTWRMLDSIILNFDQLSASIPNFQNFIKTDTSTCLPENICQDRKNLESIFKYIESKLRPTMDAACGIHLDPKDDPNHYAPWMQWMEQQADEVGFELYLRAGLSAVHYTTFLESLMVADKKFDICVENIKKSNWKAPRITDEFVDGHPPYCFRYENLTIQEMLKHEKEYTELATKAMLRAVPELLELRNAAHSALTPKT